MVTSYVKLTGIDFQISIQVDFGELTKTNFNRVNGKQPQDMYTHNNFKGPKKFSTVGTSIVNLF